MNRQLEFADIVSKQVHYALALAVILLLAFILRIWLLGNQNIWWDEGLAIWAVRQGWAQTTLWTAGDVHPPLYFWLLWLWVRLAGESEFAARFLSLACGLVTVAALYPLGKTLLGRKVALGSVILLTFSRFHIWWSQEMRMYIVATMWGVLSLYTLLRWLQTEGWLGSREASLQRRPVLQGLYILTTAAGLYTLYLFVTIILIENIFFIYLLFRQSAPHRLRSLRRWFLVQLAILGLFAPWLVLALTRMRSWSVATPFDFRVLIQLYATLLTLGISTYIERYTWLVVPFFVIVLVAQGFLWHLRTPKLGSTSTMEGESPKTVVEAGCAGVSTEQSLPSVLLFLFLLIPLVVVYVITQPRGLFYAPRVEARYLVLFAPAFYVLLAWSLAILYRQMKWIGIGAIVFVAVVFLWTLPGHYAGRYLRDEHQTTVRIIAAYAEPGDAVLLVSGNRYPIFGYYYEKLLPGDIRPPVYNLPQHALQIDHNNVSQELAPVVANHPRLWLAQVNAPMQDPENLVTRWLEQRYNKILSFGFAHNALTLFAPAGTVAKTRLSSIIPQYSLQTSLDRGAVLLGYDLPAQEFRPGDTIHLALYYSAENEARVILRIVDNQGRVLEQRESTLAPAQPVARQQFDFNVYPYTPKGLYHFQVENIDATQISPISFGKLHVAATKPLPKAKDVPIALSARLEGGIEFLGYALTNASGQPIDVLHPGDTLIVDLYWRAQNKISRNYTVFVHLVGQAYNPATQGPVWGGHDSQPLEGGYPTAQWFVNEIIVDRHMLTLDAQAPTGDYELEVGMYLLETMTRLRVLDSEGKAMDNRIVLGYVKVMQP
ncbi:MAG: glycosyltransferase family 39 protein [Anaerolineae bacterium]